MYIWPKAKVIIIISIIKLIDYFKSNRINVFFLSSTATAAL